MNSNIYVESGYDSSSPGYAEYIADMKKYSPNAPTTGDPAVSGWLAVHMFQWAATHATSMTRSAILAAMNGASAYTTGGLMPPVNYSVPSTVLGGSVPRYFTPYVYLYKYENGSLVQVGQGINGFTGAPVPSS